MRKAKRSATKLCVNPSAPRTLPTWEEMEKGLWGDLFVELEMRRALLDSDRHPSLKPMLEKEIADLESRFEGELNLFETAKRFADRERAEQQRSEINPERA